jgi:hypothetical protein
VSDEEVPLVTVGVHVRTRLGCERSVALALGEFHGIEPIELEEPGTLGVLIRDETLESAQARLREEVTRLENVLVAWPIHFEW